jgi:hypothetical protein
MKRLLLFLLLPLWAVTCHAGERANTVLLHPGEVIYVRFTQNKLKLKVTSATKEKDDQAQVILTLTTGDPKKIEPALLKVTNKFPLDLYYKAEIRSLTKKLDAVMPVLPVVREKISLEKLPPLIEEVALYGFVLKK